MAQSNFSWLAALPALRTAVAADAGAGLRALQLAVREHGAQGFEIELVGRLLRGIESDTPAFPAYRVAVLAAGTTEPIANAVRVALLLEGHRAEVYEAPFGASRQEILDPASGLYEFRPDAVLLALPLSERVHVPQSREDAEAALDREVESWRSLWDLLTTRLGTPLLQHLSEIPETEFLGAAERRAAWTPARFVEGLHARCLEAAPGLVRWIDVDRLAARVGRQNWHDQRLRYHGQFAFAPRFLPEYTQLLSGALRGAMGRTKKALIVDLDNTLWGGVIGDDGLDGIRLGPDTAEGRAYQAFANYLQDLSRRGVILGICSKNDPQTAAEVFERHPHMPLALTDFAIVCCNWDDKATNLAMIARELNVDTSALVFADDNPAECELISQSLPDVQTVLLDHDPAEFIRELDQRHLFDLQAFSADDFRRVESYRARSKSRELQARAPDLRSYLASLEMKALVAPAAAEDLPRIAQMEMKTNQFNLATRRLTLEQLQAMAASGDVLLLAVHLEDRFTNHGLVSYVAGSVAGGTLAITDWLMSCRVFSRSLEEFVFNHLVIRARQAGAQTIEARYHPTPKNRVMIGLFERLGFACAGTPPEGPWRFDVAATPPFENSPIADAGPRGAAAIGSAG